jgi:hypothetical protein
MLECSTSSRSKLGRLCASENVLLEHFDSILCNVIMYLQLSLRVLRPDSQYGTMTANLTANRVVFREHRRHLTP